jgi:hypothetical protein
MAPPEYVVGPVATDVPLLQVIEMGQALFGVESLAATPRFGAFSPPPSVISTAAGRPAGQVSSSPIH